MSLTMPQIVMMNHAAWVNGYKYRQKDKSVESKTDGAVFNGKKVDELNTDEMLAYYGDMTL